MDQRISREGGSLEGHFSIQEIFEQWWKLPILVEDDSYVSVENWGDTERPLPLEQM